MNTLFWWTGLLLWAFGALVGLGMVALWVRGKMMARRAAPRGGPLSTGESESPAPAPVYVLGSQTSRVALLRFAYHMHQRGDGVTPCTLDELMPTVVGRDS